MVGSELEDSRWKDLSEWKKTVSLFFFNKALVPAMLIGYLFIQVENGYSGLQAIHERGWVHGDVFQKNLAYDRLNSFVVFLDFGDSCPQNSPWNEDHVVFVKRDFNECISAFAQLPDEVDEESFQAVWKWLKGRFPDAPL